MENYKNIMKLVDEQIEKLKSDVEWYRKHYNQATDEVATLTKANEVLKKENEELKEELDFWKPKNEKRSNMVEGEQAK